MFSKLHQNRGGSALKVIIFLIILGLAIYIAVKMAKPYFAYKDLEKKMRYWGGIAVAQGGYDYSEVIPNIMDTVEKHDIPLEEHEFILYEDQYTNKLIIQTQTQTEEGEGYYVDVEFPGYTYTYYFKPRVEISTEQ
jgi:hypothetical protein